MRSIISITLEKDLVEQIDDERGPIPRSRYIEQKLVNVYTKQKG
jgi:hypothetical protein